MPLKMGSFVPNFISIRYRRNFIKYLLSYLIYPKNQIRRLVHSKKALRYLITSFIILCIPLWIFCIQLPRDRAKKALELTEVISKTIGTRLTAVRLIPDKNTTRFQPVLHCVEDDYAVILIKSIPSNLHMRNTLRKTWFKFLPKLDVKVHAYFFIGVPADTNITTSLKNEATEHEDIIIEDLEEDYYLLALKSLRMLKWFSNSSCSKSKYFIKTDDDMMLIIPNIISHIESVPQAWVNYIGGQLHIRDPVDTNPYSKWFSPTDWWMDEYYPPFVSGALTIISSEVVPLILNTSLTVPLHHLEDVFLTGMVAFDKLNLLPNNIPGIESNSPKWIVRIKMAFLKTFVAFHCPDDIKFMEELFSRFS